MLFLAMSCLQGEPMQQAFAALVRLGCDGIQLTPGNHPTPDFAHHVRHSTMAVRYHHSFAFDRLKEPVYRFDGMAHQRYHQDEPWSVHPPMPRENIAYELWFAHAVAAGYTTEVMYPGQWLGTGAEVQRAMNERMPLAVDISHLHIQRSAGVLNDRVLARLLDYDRIEEVHVSHNEGFRDSHLPVSEQSFLLDWAREKLAAKTPVILECYMHRLSHEARIEQIERLRH